MYPHSNTHTHTHTHTHRQACTHMQASQQTAQKQIITAIQFLSRSLPSYRLYVNCHSEHSGQSKDKIISQLCYYYAPASTVALPEVWFTRLSSLAHCTPVLMFCSACALSHLSHWSLSRCLHSVLMLSEKVGNRCVQRFPRNSQTVCGTTTV